MRELKEEEDELLRLSELKAERAAASTSTSASASASAQVDEAGKVNKTRFSQISLKAINSLESYEQQVRRPG
jgi:hypothetical protein